MNKGVMTTARIAAYKGHVTRALKACETELANPSALLPNLEFKCEKLKESYERYSQAFLQFEEEQEATGDEYDAASHTFETVESDYNQRRSQLNTRIAALNTRSVPQQSQPTNKPQLKLPTIELPTFSGERQDWPTFWETFFALVHNRPDLEDVIKFSYLRQSMKGEAARQIKGFTGVGTDYVNAVAILTKFYADKRAIRFELTKKLLALKAPKCNKNDLIEFQIAYNTILRQLEDYVDDISTSAWAVEAILQDKLPSEFAKYLYDRYHDNFFTQDQITEGIQDFSKRFENSCRIESDICTSKGSSSRAMKSLTVPSTVVQNVSVNKGCIFCNSSHSSRHCTQYPTVSARKAQLEAAGRCKRCCTANHKASDCRITTFNPCITCKKTNHHGYLCYQLQPASSNVNATSVSTSLTKASSTSVHNAHKPNSKGKVSSSSHICTESKKTESTTPNTAVSSETGVSTLSLRTEQSLEGSVAIHFSSATTGSAALPTAMVKVQKTNCSSPEEIRCFFDQGAQRTFITKSLQESLGLNPVSKLSMTVSHGFDDSIAVREYDIVKPIVCLGKYKKRISALVVPALPNAIQTPGLSAVADGLRTKDMRLADQYNSDTVRNIELLIGGDYYGGFINGLTQYRGINLMKTSAGYIIYGPVSNIVSEETNNVQLRNITVADFTVFTEEPPVHRLWDLDAIGIDANAPIPQDDDVYQNYLSTVQYTDKYLVRLPWRKDHPPLPNNYKMAVGQLHAMHRSLVNQPEMLKHYHQIITDQRDQGIIEVVSNPKVDNTTHYIPHHAVKKDSPTTPVRIVYNCSAKSSPNVPSLNDCLMKGPALTEKLGDILVTFRTNKYAFSADISRAFLRIGLQEADRDFTRFLWLEDPFDSNPNIVTYRFCSVLFGATSSPFLLQATLDFHLQNSISPYKDLIRENFYVDNLVGSLNSENSLLEYYKDANKILLSANMPLREWSSCSKLLQAQIHEDQNGTRTDKIKLLGLQWNTENDTLQLYPLQFYSNPGILQTKRKLLADISKVFDPLGICTPVTIRGRILLQKAWKLKLGWDEPLPDEFNSIWENLAADLSQLSSIQIPRESCDEDSTTHLVIFCDASTSAYGVVAYAVTDRHARLLLSKARVAPLKSRTLPQLELTALQMGAQLAHYLTTTLHRITFIRITIFSDNEPALQWVKNDNCSIPYVKNRVHKILELISDKPVQILHVTSSDNPADLLTRGISFKKFQKRVLQFWLHGPSWLFNEDSWPTQRPSVVVQELCTDVKTTDNLLQVLPSPIDPTRFSKFSSLINVTQYVFKFTRSVLIPIKYWIKHIQQSEYPQVYHYLLTLNNDTGSDSFRVSSLLAPIKKFVKDLGLYIDGSGIIRSHSRLRFSLYHTEDQILLPPKSYVTKLIILQIHRAVKHGNMVETLTQARLTYWIPKGRLTVKAILKSCAHCCRIFAFRIANPGPPPLPPERVQFVRPFHSVGIDYTGAILIRDEPTNEYVKVYICLFTCTCTRAVHLELAKDMSAPTFITLFRRFCARFSTPHLVISDNGSSFKASASFFKSLFEDPLVSHYFSDQRITWKFIAPLAPWQGGFYERMVGIVKSSLRKTLFKRVLSWDDLVTILLEVEQCVNNRPLTYVTSELPNMVALTPNHLLKGEASQIMPPVATVDQLDPLYFDHDLLNQQYSKLSEVVKGFVQVWSKDYLTALKEKHYGNVPPHQVVSIKEGDIVLVSNDYPRNRWPLGRITKVFPDSDQIVRQVEVISQGHTSIRTLDKLYALELAVKPNVQDVPDGPEIEREVESTRQKRRAASKADADRQLLIDADLL